MTKLGDAILEHYAESCSALVQMLVEQTNAVSELRSKVKELEKKLLESNEYWAKFVDDMSVRIESMLETVS